MCPNPEKPFIQSNTVWYSHANVLGQLERIVIIQTIFFPKYGRYVLYSPIDLASTTNSPLCTNERIFRMIYTPMDHTPCVTLPRENSSSKTFLQRLRSLFTGPRKALASPRLR